MMPAVHHFAPIVGVDIHIIQPVGPVPPVPIPHPHIGMVFDPMDYLPNPIPAIISSYQGAPTPQLRQFATVHVGPFKRAQAGTAGVALPTHVPIGGMFVLWPGNESEAFMGSSTVAADGDAMSYLALPALTCQSIGMPAIPRLRPAKTTSLVLPMGVMLPVPFGVLVGGTPTISLMAIGMRIAVGSLLSGLGAAVRSAKKYRAKRRARLQQNGCCGKVGEPVDVVTGANANYHEDLASDDGLFTLRRHYSTARKREHGPFGFGVRHHYQRVIRLRTQGWIYEDPEGHRLDFEPLLGAVTMDRTQGVELRRVGQDLLRLSERVDETLEFEIRGHEARLVRWSTKKGELRFEYDGARLTSVVKETPGRELVTYELLYDHLGHITTVLRRSETECQPVMSYRYDGHRNLIKSIDARGATTTYEYDDAHRWIRLTDARGYSFRWRYDRAGRCIRTWGEDGLWWAELEYLDGETKVSERGGGVWTYRYNGDGTITEIVDPYGGVKRRRLGPDGRVEEEVDSGGRSLIWLYDEQGRNTGRVDRFGCISAPEAEEPTPRDSLARVFPTTPEAWTIGVADDRSELPEVASLQGIHDVARLLAAEIRTTHESRTMEYYDDCGRVISRALEGCSESFAYDEVGNLVAHVDRDGSRSGFQITSWNLVGTEIVPTGEQIHYDYTSTEQVASIVDPNGNVFAYEYDEKDRLVAVLHGNEPYEAYRYDVGDRLVEKCDARGSVLFTQEFSSNSLVTKRALNGREEHCFEYDERGQITKACIRERTPGSKLTSSFSERSTVTMDWVLPGTLHLDLRDGKGVEHDHFVDWLASTTILGRFATEYRYEPERHATIVVDPTGASHTVQRTAEGGVLRIHPSGTSELRMFSREGLLRDRVRWAHGADALQQTRYTYSAEGDLLSICDSELGRREFEFDAAHRLAASASHIGVTRYPRDGAGNLVHKPGLDAVAVGAQNRLRYANNEEFIYDHRGALVERIHASRRIRYSYDSLDQLVAIQSSKDEAWTAEYDALGRRTRTTFKTTGREFYWDGDRLAAELAPNGSFRVYVYPNGESWVPIAFVDYESVEAAPESGRSYVLFTDQVGMPERVEDASGAVVWSASQTDVYGPLDIDPNSTIELNLRWPGHYYDPETGLHYNRFRYYDPQLGRYLTCDPSGLAGGPNLYAYVGNPLVDVDLLGLHGKAGKADANAAKNADGSGREVVARPRLAERIRASANRFAERARAKIFVHSILAEGTITIVADRGMKKFIMRDLEELASTRTGRVLLKGINKNEKKVRIMVQPSDADWKVRLRTQGPYAGAEPSPASMRLVRRPTKDDDPGALIANGELHPAKDGKMMFAPVEKGTRMEFAGRGKGTETDVLYDPRPGSPHTSVQTPSSTLLVHELGHAYNHGRGQALPSVLRPGMDPSKQTSLEEVRVIRGVENQFRKERGLPLRRDHSALPGLDLKGKKEQEEWTQKLDDWYGRP